MLQISIFYKKYFDFFYQQIGCKINQVSTVRYPLSDEANFLKWCLKKYFEKVERLRSFMWDP